MPQLDVSTYISQIFWLGICYTILLVFCFRHSIPQLDRLSQQRWAQNEGLREQAHALIYQTALLQEEMDQHLADAKVKTHQQFQTMRQQISQETEQSKVKIHVQFKRQVMEMEQKLQQQYQSELSYIEEKAQELVPLIVEKLSEKATLSCPNFSMSTLLNLGKETSYVH